MKPTLEQLLTDIYALDASLREQDAEVRSLVQNLLTEKPVVAADAAFRARLRAELLAERTVVAPKIKQPALPWWLYYAAPIGFATVLILMLVPEYTKTQAPFVPTAVPTTIEQSAPEADEALFMDVPVESPAAKRGAAVSTESEQSTFGVAADMAQSDLLYVGTQEPGQVVLVESALLTAPAYVVIQEIGQSEAVLGMSDIMLLGEQLPFAVTLQTSLLSGSMYEAVLYQDDGDGLRATTSDVVVFAMSFSVSVR